MPGPSVPANPDRLRADACPGVLRLTAAADGSLARVRLPGGFVPPGGFAALAAAAAELGDGRLELTSRGNVQLRGLAPDAGPELGERLAAAGLWPSASHEQVRNIVASPLAGLDSPVSLEPVVRALDEAICADPRLAQLSGRFLFAVDDGRGDVAGLGADVLLDGRSPDAVRTAHTAAHTFLDERAAQNGAAWRIIDLPDASRFPAPAPARGLPPGIGPFVRHDGGTGLVLAVPLGRLRPDQLAWLADRPDLRVTPWRSLVLPTADATTREQAGALGFGVSPGSLWASVTACAGRPGCAKSHADVQSDARDAVARWPGQVVHWSGCERRCGRPARTQVDVVATENGYDIRESHA